MTKLANNSNSKFELNKKKYLGHWLKHDTNACILIHNSL